MFFRVRILVFHLNDRGGNFGDPEVLVYVFNVGGHDLWMACWVLTLLFDPGIKTPEIDMLYFFIFRVFILKLAGICASFEKAFPGV